MNSINKFYNCIFKSKYHFKHLYRGALSPDLRKNNSEHYENTPMQYTAIFNGCKNNNFQMKNSDIFLIFAQNIDCLYTLEPPQ